MTKIELAYKIGSQNILGPLKSIFGTWFLIAVSIAVLSILSLNYGSVKKLRSEVFPKIRKSISEYEAKPGKVYSKNYSIKSIKKMWIPSPISVYIIESDEIKPKKDNSSIYMLVYSEFEERFLQDSKSKHLKLEYNENSADKPRLVYPALSQWPGILDELDSNSFSLHITSLKIWAKKFNQVSTMELPEENTSNFEDWFHLLIIPFVLIGLYKHQNKRRSIFLKHFKKEDLISAEPCSIERAKKSLNFFKRKFGNVSSVYGSVYKVTGKEDVYVIYNGSKAKTADGVLLKYEDQYYFIHKNWLPKNPTKKAA